MKTFALLSFAAGLSLFTACASPAPSASAAGASSAAVAAASSGVRPYTKNTCIVSGNELGSMGPVVTKVHQGQQVKFCCKPCVKKFEANPGKYLSRI